MSRQLNDNCNNHFANHCIVANGKTMTFLGFTYNSTSWSTSWLILITPRMSILIQGTGHAGTVWCTFRCGCLRSDARLQATPQWLRCVLGIRPPIHFLWSAAYLDYKTSYTIQQKGNNQLAYTPHGSATVIFGTTSPVPSAWDTWRSGSSSPW